ncbi:MAG: DMT family transporter [Bacteroidota bacterium]|nr:DMT family transporter [Bacteroidota bacterium]
MKKAWLNMHFAIFLWGFTGILGKAIQMSEGMIVWYRLVISAVGLLPLLYHNKVSLPSRKEMLFITCVGVIVTMHWVLFYGAIKASNVSIALSCFSSISLFTALLEPLSQRKKPKIAEILLGISVIAGLYIIFSVKQIYLTGILLAIGSAFLGALFTVLNKKLTATHPPEVITFYELASGFIILTILLPLYFCTTGTTFEVPGTMDLVYLLILGLVCTSFAFTISLKALKHLDAFTLNLSVNLEPLYSILLAMLLFKEYDILNSGFIAGTLIILGSVMVHTWYRWKSTPAT